MVLLAGGGARAQTFDQVTAIDEALANGTARGQSVVTDAAGNVLVTGIFQGSLTLGNTTLVNPGIPYVGSDAVFVAKLDAAGNWLWAVRASNTGATNGFGRNASLALDAAGTPYLVASLLGSFTFGTTTLTSSNTGTDVVVARLNGATGAWEWAVRASTSNSLNANISNGITVDGKGHVYVTGSFVGSATFSNASAASPTLTSNGAAADIFVARLDALTGNWQWAVRGGGTENDQGASIVADAADNIYVTGAFRSTDASPATFAPAAGAPLTLASRGSAADIFVARLDGTTGAWQWAARAGSTQDDAGASVAADATGHVYVTGGFVGGGTTSSYPPVYIPAATFDSPSGSSLTLAGASGSDIFVARLDAVTGSWQWAVRGGSYGADAGTSIAVDATGVPFITGYFRTFIPSGPAEFSPTVSGSPILLAGNTSQETSFAFVAQLEESTGKWRWVVPASNVPNGSGGNGLAVKNGRIYTTGFYTNNGTFSSSQASGVIGGNNANAFVAQTDANNGSWLWVKNPDAGGVKQVTSAATDAAGNVYVSGVFQGKLTLGTTTLVSAGPTSTGFIAKRDPAGNWQWAVRVTTSQGLAETGIAVDATGHLYTTGSFSGVATFYNAAGTALTVNGGSTYVARLDVATGNWQWAVCSTGGSGPFIGSRIAVDAAGNPYVSGLFQRTMTFAGSNGPITLASTIAPNEYTYTTPDLFVARLSPTDGTWQWAVRAGGASNDFSGGIAADPTGHVFVTGAYIGNATFSSPNGGVLTVPGFANGTDIFVARLDAATGAWQWATRGGSNAPLSGADDFGKAIAVGTGGDAYITGSFTGNATFGNLALGTNLASVTDSRTFVARLDGATGAWRWVVRGGGNQGTSLQTDAAGRVYAAGDFRGTVTFDSPTLSPLLTTTSQGGSDVFVARLDAASGAWQNLATYGSRANEQSAALLLTPQNNAYVAGNYTNAQDFASAPPINYGPLYNTGFVARLSSGWVLPVREQQQEAQKASFQVFPTAISAGQALHYVVEEQLGKTAIIELCTLTGQRVARWSVSSAAGMLPAPTLRAGIYLVRLTTAGTTQATRIIVY
ncbi:hypothetical protein GCM10011383_34000 [Hymenobacter cavernae]|uniref:T9SS C-terminal target domain-containing protein n=1 Tax=Hymenobacter cavernae TaxID=2044852 RepID=A0ABQ1UL84_9BACT|nr:hypothetical protein GCM10011383_34000 [Hymenobacter cavernae]